MSTGKVFVLVAVALTAFSGVAVAATEALTKRATHERTLMRPVDRVVVRADDGDVKLVAARAPRVTLVSRERWLWRQPHVSTVQHGSTLDVRADCPNVGVMDRCTADLELRVPFDTDVTVDGGAGDISVDGLAGHVTLRTGAGDVTGRNLVPVSVTASTDVGDLDLSFATSPVDVRASSDAGDVDIQVPPGEYRVDTVSNAGADEVGGGVLRNDRATRRIVARADAGDVLVHGTD
jgi:hypothetical protein